MNQKTKNGRMAGGTKRILARRPERVPVSVHRKGGAVVNGYQGYVHCVRTADIDEFAGYLAKGLKQDLGLIGVNLTPKMAQAVGKTALRNFLFAAPRFVKETHCRLSLDGLLDFYPVVKLDEGGVSRVILAAQPRAEFRHGLDGLAVKLSPPAPLPAKARNDGNTYTLETPYASLGKAGKSGAGGSSVKGQEVAGGEKDIALRLRVLGRTVQVISAEVS